MNSLIAKKINKIKVEESDIQKGERKVELWADSVDVEIINVDYKEKDPFFNINTNFNIQHYNINEGFNYYHYERDGLSSCTRNLVFMTYLNNVEDGGTQFKYQNLITPAKKGLTLIWPTDFTHTHRGVISQTKEKYIVTGWYTYTT